jgi:hypothetical protein
MRKKEIIQQTISEFLELSHKAWFIELEIGDFGASISDLLQIPLHILEKNLKFHFWMFLKQFLTTCHIGFIQRTFNKYESGSETVNLALIGQWEGKNHAIPLWILRDLLLGFEVIKPELFMILDTEKLYWPSIRILDDSKQKKEDSYVVFLKEDIFSNKKVHLQLKNKHISVSKYYDEIGFFEWIARTKIPELDD